MNTAPNIRTLAAILADPKALQPPRAVVERFAWSGRVTLLAAREKAGKSTLISALASAASTGRRFLGDETIQGRVLIIGLEEHLNDLRDLLPHEDEIRSVEGPFNRSDTPDPGSGRGVGIGNDRDPTDSARVRECEPPTSSRPEPLGGCLRASEAR